MSENFTIKEDGVLIELRINKNIYSKEVVIQTTYVLLDKYYFLIDEIDSYWIVQMRVKSNFKNVDENIKLSKNDALLFFDELIESSSYLDQLKRTSKIREVILEKAVLSQTIDEELEEID